MAAKLKQRKGTKWDLSKLQMGQFISMTNYLTVTGINNREDLVDVRNQHGQCMTMSKELLETMYSGSHFDSIFPLNMTGLAALLQSVGDVVITVNFYKQVNSEEALDKLMKSDASYVNDDKKRAQMARSILQGEYCSLTCRMVQV